MADHIEHAPGSAHRRYDKDLGNHIKSEIDKRGLTVVGRMWDFGFRQTTSSDHKIMTPSDLQSKGLTFLTPELSPFKSELEKVGYYTSLKAKYDPATWSLLEKYSGNLA